VNLPEAPVADQGFFVTHFFTVRDQEKSKDFYVRILGGKLIKPEDPCYIKLVNSWIILNSASFASLVLKLLLVPIHPDATPTNAANNKGNRSRCNLKNFC
jgi:hypothetical protein